MNNKKSCWFLKGLFFECCAQSGHCALWFGRDLNTKKGCESVSVFKIEEGYINNVDVGGLVLFYLRVGLGPKVSEVVKGLEKGSAYVSESATGDQRKVVAPFASRHIGLEMLKKELGVKFVRIEIEEKQHNYRITMPHGQVQMEKTVGGDGKNPIMMLNNKLEGVREDPRMAFINNFTFYTTVLWNYKDYDLDLKYKNVSGCVGDFIIKGDSDTLNYYDDLRKSSW